MFSFLVGPVSLLWAFYPRVLMRVDPPTYLDEELDCRHYLEEHVRDFLPERWAHQDWREKLIRVDQQFEASKVTHGFKSDVLPNEPSSATPPEDEAAAENSGSHPQAVPRELTAHPKLRKVHKVNALQRFRDACKRVELLFEVQTRGLLVRHPCTSLLSHDLDWAAVHVSLERKRPFDKSSICKIYHPANYNPSSFCKLPNSNPGKPWFLEDLPLRINYPQLSDFWLHIPANNESWMKVSSKLLLFTYSYVTLTGCNIEIDRNNGHIRQLAVHFSRI